MKKYILVIGIGIILIFIVNLDNKKTSEKIDFTTTEIISEKENLELKTAKINAEKYKLEAEQTRLEIEKLKQENKTKLQEELNLNKLKIQTTVIPLPQNNIQSIETQIDGEFNGWDGETLYKLTNGQYWQQSTYYYEYSYSYMPEVLIYKSDYGYKMRVEGIGEAVGVQQVFNVIEGKIDGDFEGWEGETVYSLTNGQVWQQSSYHYHYHYAFQPEVLIYPSGSGYKMHVVGDSDQEIDVIRLK